MARRAGAALCALLPAAAAGQEPRILSCIAGLPRCVGVPNIDDAAAWGCPIINVTDCGGKTTTETCGPCTAPAAAGMACLGQGLSNRTGQDGTPVTFSLPVDMGTVSADHFQWRFADGTTRKAGCAMAGGRPANEGNEGQTIAIVGDAGGWGSFAVALEIVGDLMLVTPNGTKVSANGLTYRGPSLDVSSGLTLLTATYEAFSTDGEILRNPIAAPAAAYPNHCRALFPGTTHRIQLLFDGGVSLDGRRGVTPDRTDLFELADESGAPFPAGAYLGLADLGSSIPTTQCEKDTYAGDMDNYVDLCLKVAAGQAPPATVRLPCGKDTQISKPSGVRYPCRKQAVAITVRH